MWVAGAHPQRLRHLWHTHNDKAFHYTRDDAGHSVTPNSFLTCVGQQASYWRSRSQEISPIQALLVYMVRECR